MIHNYQLHLQFSFSFALACNESWVCLDYFSTMKEWNVLLMDNTRVTHTTYIPRNRALSPVAMKFQSFHQFSCASQPFAQWIVPFTPSGRYEWREVLLIMTAPRWGSNRVVLTRDSAASSSWFPFQLLPFSLDPCKGSSQRILVHLKLHASSFIITRSFLPKRRFQTGNYNTQIPQSGYHFKLSLWLA